MTPKDPLLEGTFWDKFWRPIRSRALLFTPEMEMNGRSSASNLACTPCVPLFYSLFNRGGNRRASRFPGDGGDHFHCTVEPSPGHTMWAEIIAYMIYLEGPEILNM